MVADYFRALPAYLGGKRRLTPLIFAALNEVVPREEWSGAIFLDPFLGGGSVSLHAKAVGFEVHCNDVAFRSALIGHALIENSVVHLTSADLENLLERPPGAYPRRAEERLSPAVFPKAHARLIDLALHWAGRYPRPKRELLLLVLVKWLLRCQPMSMVRGTDARAAASGDLDPVSPRRLGHYLKARQLMSQTAFTKIFDEVNAGVFPGRGKAYQGDALEFLVDVDGDVVYLDPPYAGTTSYEREYAVIDELLEGNARPVSRFSGRTPPLAEMLALARADVLLLSYYSLGRTDTEEIRWLVAQTHTLKRLIEVPYRHLRSIAGAERNQKNRELLVVATRR